MSDLCRLIWCALIGLFRSRAALEAEFLVLRHQLNMLRRKSPKRLAFGNIDRLVFTALYRAAPGVLDALKIIKPQTIIRWHQDSIRLSLSSIRPSIGTKNPIPEEMDHREIAVRVPVMNEMQFLFPSEPCKSLKPRSLYVVFLVEKDVRVERRSTRD